MQDDARLRQDDRDDADRHIALVLQGGGALGSYQAGVYEGLAASPYQPDWVAGISIGAVNAAIIAGNPPGKRVEALRNFWEHVTSPTAWWPSSDPGPADKLQREASAASAVLYGQPGFFTPRPPFAWFSTPTSYYDTSQLRGTLTRIVDFDRINAPSAEVRLSVGAVDLQTGQMNWFDSAHMKLGVEHILASGALPPGFPAIEIDGKQYWDGGLVSNTPLQYVLDYYPRHDRLCFQVDLFQSYGNPPKNIDQVAEREKDIRYSSRTRVATEAFKDKHDVRRAIDAMLRLMPDHLLATPEGRRLQELSCETTMDIVQLIYRPFEPQGPIKDFEFGRASMLKRWNEGLKNAEMTLAAAPWKTPPPDGIGVRTFDVIHDLLVNGTPAAPSAIAGTKQDTTQVVAAAVPGVTKPARK